MQYVKAGVELHTNRSVCTPIAQNTDRDLTERPIQKNEENEDVRREGRGEVPPDLPRSTVLDRLLFTLLRVVRRL